MFNKKLKQEMEAQSIVNRELRQRIGVLEDTLKLFYNDSEKNKVIQTKEVPILYLRLVGDKRSWVSRLSSADRFSREQAEVIIAKGTDRIEIKTVRTK